MVQLEKAKLGRGWTDLGQGMHYRTLFGLENDSVVF